MPIELLTIYKPKNMIAIELHGMLAYHSFKRIMTKWGCTMNVLKEQFLQLEQQLMYYRRTDFTQLLAEDFLEFGSSGGKMDKNFQFNHVTDDGLVAPLFSLSDFDIRILAEHLVQTLFVTTHIETEKKANRSSIWRNEEGIWRMCFHQGTPKPH